MLIIYTFMDTVDDDENRTNLEHEKGMTAKVQCAQTGTRNWNNDRGRTWTKKVRGELVVGTKIEGRLLKMLHT